MTRATLGEMIVAARRFAEETGRPQAVISGTTGCWEIRTIASIRPPHALRIMYRTDEEQL
jgi:hypothetical protein